MSAAAVDLSAADRPKMFGRLLPLARSLLINFAAPYGLYRLVESWFAPDSPMPLLLCALIPLGVFGLTLRRRVVDAIALLSLSQLAVGIAVSLLSGSAHQALFVHALQSGGLGLVFAGSALIGRPLIRPLARQIMAGDDPRRQARFDEAARLSRVRRRFTVMTLIWAAGLCGESAVRVVALRHLPPAEYMLLANMLGYGTIGVLVWGSVAYGRRKASEEAQAEAH